MPLTSSNLLMVDMTSLRSTFTGAPSIKTWSESFVTRQPLIRMSIATITLASGSAMPQSKNIISNAAMMAPTEPSRSPITCRNAALIFRLSCVLPLRCNMNATIIFTINPTIAMPSMPNDATSGGFLNEPVSMQEITLTPSERAEIVIDFSQVKTNEEIALVNEEGTTLLPFEITDQTGKTIDIPDEMNDFSFTEEEKNLPVTKEIELFGMMDQVTINGKKFDSERIDFTQEQGVTEVWEIYNKPDMMGGMIHPFHIHGAQFKILSRNGEAPPENERGWKDSFSVAPDETVKIAIQFKNKGIYMFHCHILEHEDNGMMGQVKVE